MKKLLFIPMFTIFSITTIFVSCKPSAKEEAAQENVEIAKDELADARKEANQEEWQSFKDEMNVVIVKNEARIDELKQDVKKSGESANHEYDKKIDALKAKNAELKTKMNLYKNDANSDWKSFKSEFNHDMDELGESLKNFTVNNK